MIRQLAVLRCFYRRGKARREHIHLKDSLKDLTTAPTIEKQAQEHRQMFETDMPNKTLTQTLNEQNPKLQQRFKIDRQDLQKKIRKRVGQQLKIQRIIPAAQGQQFQTLQSKSHIYDQRAQLQFEQKFRTQLFKKKETNRLIEKQKNDYRNYLENPKNEQFVQYKENMNRLKNSKIESMMNFRRNNQQLRLLIDSGYIDNPHNLAVVLDKINQTPQIEGNQSIGKQQALGNSSNHNHQAQHSSQNLQSKTLQSQTQLSPSPSQSKQLYPQYKEMHQKMMHSINGPQQLRNPQMLQQFFQNLKLNTQVEKQKAKQDLQLMKQIKQFQAVTFENRYNTINFRFKGQVDFSWMKQQQLLSYIKTQRNINTQPQGLLTMYQQQKSLQNRFNQPIITPTVMSRIYSVCSLYNFPQTDQNNRINMLNDKKYIDLERNLFRNINQLSDQSFADAVFAYCRNHKQEQGLLRPKMSEKIVEVMWKELNDRVNSISQQDLGLVLRSLIHTPMLKNQKFEWLLLVSALSERLPSMQKDYEFQSVMSFLSLVPSSQESIQTVSQNMTKFKTYKWQSRQTLQSFMECTSFLIRFKSQYSPMRQHKMIQQLKHLFATKYQEIMPILEQMSINKMPQLLSIIYLFEKSKQLDARYEIQIPNKLINKCKKEIIDNVKMQKQLINKYTVGNITMSMALIDYCKSLSSEVQVRENQLPVLQQSITLSLFPFRAIPFNSINYFTYHQLTKLVNSQIRSLPVKAIAQTVFAASLVRYKNEGIYQQIMSRTVQKIHYEMKQSGESQTVTHLKYNKEYILFICSFHHCRMVNQYYYHFMEYLKDNGASTMVTVEPNLLLRFFQTIASLNFTTDPKYEQDYAITSHFAHVFDLCYGKNFKNCLGVFRKQQLLVLQYVSSLFEFFKTKQRLSTPQQKNKNNNSQAYLKRVQEIQTHLSKHQPKLTIQDQYLQSITKLLTKMTHHLQLLNQNQIQLHSLIDPQFISAETNYYNFAISTIMDQQQHIGSQFKYETIYENVRKKLVSENMQMKIDPKKWRIENPQIKEVFFFTTYEHLFAKYQDESTSVRLFGFWKVYYELYALKNWKFRFICTFLEG